MYCKRCGSALPSHGFICKSCGAMMDINQIKEQKGYMKENKQVTLMSDLYDSNPNKRNFEKIKENKYLGAIVIVLIFIILIIVAILKVMK